MIGLAFNKSDLSGKAVIAHAIKDTLADGSYPKLLKKYNLEFPNEALLKQNGLENALDNAILASENGNDKTISKGFNWSYLAEFIRKY
ncbi:MAG: hypothetical protein ACLR5N_01415 [Haemophilus parainfluenzae]